MNKKRVEKLKRHFEFMQADQYMTEEEYEQAAQYGLELIETLEVERERIAKMAKALRACKRYVDTNRGDVFLEQPYQDPPLWQVIDEALAGKRECASCSWIDLAPEMLAACKSVLREWESEILMEMDPEVGLSGPVYDTEPIKMVRAVIAKVEAADVHCAERE